MVYMIFTRHCLNVVTVVCLAETVLDGTGTSRLQLAGDTGSQALHQSR